MNKFTIFCLISTFSYNYPKFIKSFGQFNTKHGRLLWCVSRLLQTKIVHNLVFICCRYYACPSKFCFVFMLGKNNCSVTMLLLLSFFFISFVQKGWNVLLGKLQTTQRETREAQKFQASRVWTEPRGQILVQRFGSFWGCGWCTLVVVSISAQGLEEPWRALHFILGKGKKRLFIDCRQWSRFNRVETQSTARKGYIFSVVFWLKIRIHKEFS